MQQVSMPFADLAVPPSGTDIEDRIVSLLRGIPSGIDPVLDSYRQSSAGDANYSTSVNRQTRAFMLYRAYAESGKRILDWGCRHALDACMVRMVNPRAEISGCDMSDAMADSTREFAGLSYTPLDHPWKLPYADASFDRVISAGVLEHVPMTQASLTELNRIIEPEGYLLITFLPNILSYTEFLSRRVLRKNYHRRCYSLGWVRRLLLEHGFEPVEYGYHQVMPSLISGHAALRWPWLARFFRSAFKLDPYVERIWPLKMFAANIYVIARKREYM